MKLYLRLYLILVVVQYTSCSIITENDNEKLPRPNIIYIFTDQQFGGAMSNAGNQYLKTPAMDKLASQGLSFDLAYCTFPLCVPSRASMMSGRMPHEAGIFINTYISEEPFRFPMLGKIMTDNGYNSHWVGKWHLPVLETDKELHGFDEIMGGGGYGGLDSMKAIQAIEFLNRDHKKPFFLVVSLNNPHDCCELSRGDELKMGSIPALPSVDQLPPLHQNYEIPDQEPDYLRIFQDQYPKVFPSSSWNDQEFREYIWGYYRLVEKVDKDLATILDVLEASGLDENTVVIFSSDHGDGLGMHKWNQKFSLYDESARVPFIISWKGKVREGNRSKIPISAGLDLLPTVCDFAGIEPPKGSLGKSLREIALGKSSNINRKYVVTETGFGMWANVGEDIFQKARMLRTERYKYIAYDKGDKNEQLFDMIEDPGEMIDLSVNNQFSEILKQHQEYLAEWLKKTNDSFNYIIRPNSIIK